ncbi:MAG: hypothetical protein QF860_00335 [Planctomycetota bacterium]|jgi:YVTN family beta-propeller protein|nr:hypothetical protein [Planctomycetota bacterium]
METTPMTRGRRPLLVSLALAALSGAAGAQDSFVNFESPHVSPLALSGDGSVLCAVNTPDNRLAVFDATGPAPVLNLEVPVGLDPVSVRFRTATEVWVVNHVSDSVSVVDLALGNVVATIDTADEPCDVVFAGTPERAFVTCSQANSVLVFDPSDLSIPPASIDILGEDPRAMAVSPDGQRVYVAVFDSGNATTVLGGGIDGGNTLAFPPNVVNEPLGPHGGQNPPPNAGGGFSPPQNPANPAPPRVSLIVRKDDAGQWMDDSGGDWTQAVSGSLAATSGRPVGWDLYDHDVAVIDVASLSVSYADRLMNICMALAVHPVSGEVTVVGTEATNEVRFEPNLTGTFVRVHAALVDPFSLGANAIVDLNAHLDYSVPTLPQAERDLALGDPRGVVWTPTGERAFVTGMGSNNLIVIDGAGARAGLAPTIEVGEGPTGLALDAAAGRLYVLNKFASSISVVDTVSELETAQVPFYDPSPAAIGIGRKHLYDTHKNSGLGQVACASCHVDARMDRLGWDLGNPAGDVKSVAGQNLGMGLPGLDTGFEDWHPMKGPMTTQTLQDIIGKEPLHWRGDKDGLEEFAGAFTGLQGDDTTLTGPEFGEFEDFLATIHFPPNPFRNRDNSLPDDMDLAGHYTPGRFGPAGLPLPNGDAVRGVALYRPPNALDAGVLACVTCHTLPTGMGADYTLVGATYVEIPPGPLGERHHALVSQDGVTNISMKIPHLRNLYDKVGMEFTQQMNTSGFGFIADGSVDSIARFVAEPAFTVGSVQDIADLTAFMLSFAGSDLPEGSPTDLLEPPGTASKDAHAAVGLQTTLVDAASADPAQLALIDEMIDLSEHPRVGLVVKGVVSGEQRGATHLGLGLFQTDRADQLLWANAVLDLAAPGSELTFTLVPGGSETRMGVDRDEDGHYDRDELDYGSDPADPDDYPLPTGVPFCLGDGGGAPCPCSNDDPGGAGGCANSTGAGALLYGEGVPDTVSDSVVLRGANLLASQPALLFQGTVALNGGDGVPFGDGLRCAGGSVIRIHVVVPDASGTVAYPQTGDPSISQDGAVSPGDTRTYQYWYRNPSGSPCGSGFNLTNGFEISWF